MIRVLTFVLCLMLAVPVFAQDDALESEEAIAQRTMEISKTLRCMVCQGQSVADSDATLAQDIRRLVEIRVRAGDSDDEVRAYFRTNYGDYILMEPPFQWTTLALWLGPLVLVLMGGSWFVLNIRRQGATDGPVGDDQELSEEERARLASLMGEDGTTK